MEDIRRYLNVVLESETHEDDYDSEIKSSYGRGSYNFPWKSQDQFGMASARFRTSGAEIVIDITRIVDSLGNPVEADPELMKRIREQGYDFIGKA